MNDTRFRQLLAGEPATVAEFKLLYETTVHDLKHAVGLRDENDIDAVVKAFDGWLNDVLRNMLVGGVSVKLFEQKLIDLGMTGYVERHQVIDALMQSQINHKDGMQL